MPEKQEMYRRNLTEDEARAAAEINFEKAQVALGIEEHNEIAIAPEQWANALEYIERGVKLCQPPPERKSRPRRTTGKAKPNTEGRPKSG